jgi:hypothetical protein
MAHRTASTALPNSASTIASRVGDAASMARNQPVQDFPSRGERILGSNLIGAHEATIAFDVSREDGRQPALYFNSGCQGSPQSQLFPRAYLGTPELAGSIAFGGVAPSLE